MNINRGYNQTLMEKCHRLWEYSEFSSEIEESIKSGMRREEAIHTAIDTCIEKGILKDIFRERDMTMEDEDPFSYPGI